MSEKQTAAFRLASALGAALLAGCGAVADSIGSRDSNIDPNPVTFDNPTRAVCGPGASEETGLQGQVSRADRQSGRSMEGYWCNLERIGHYRHGEGASWQFAWYDDCGYYGTLPSTSRETDRGAVVVDAKNPAAPVGTALLQTPAMMDPHESLKANERRRLLAAVDIGDVDSEGSGTLDYFDVYDITDCRQPKLLSSQRFDGTIGHEGEWAPDGLTYYGTTGLAENDGGTVGQVNAFDVSDPQRTSLIDQIDQGSHGLGVSDDGMRAYLAALDTRAGNGLKIFDVSEIQRRIPNPRTRLLGEVGWADGAAAQHAIPLTYGGKPFVLFVDEAGYGTSRFIDISDETSPKVISKMKLEIHLEENRAIATADGAAALIQYDAHYCSVDRRDDPTIAACGYAWSGIRVFDIRDPYLPREIAYYVPPAINEQLAGSSNSGGGAQTVDRCASQVRILRTRDGGGQLWTQCQDNEFMVLRFTNGVWPFGS
jgi:hypothetical protein